MVWPLEYEERVNTKAFHALLARSNPDTRKWNKADISGRGPDGKVFTSWGREFSLFSSLDTPANYREKIFNIPSNFTSFAEVQWGKLTIETMRVAAMAAPSKIGTMLLTKIYANEIDNKNLSIIALTDNLPTKGLLLEKLGNLLKHAPCSDGLITIDDVNRALQIAYGHRNSSSATIIHGDEIFSRTEAFVYYCAWGCGRSGTILSAYQLLEDFVLAFARNDKELLRYVRDYVELPKIYLSEYYDESLKKMVENKTSVHEKRDHEVLVINKPHEFADPMKESSYEMCPTTGPVASAINRIRNITSPEIISVEKRTEVSVLEEIEKKLCFSMHQYCLENGVYDRMGIESKCERPSPKP